MPGSEWNPQWEHGATKSQDSELREYELTNWDRLISLLNILNSFMGIQSRALNAASRRKFRLQIT